MTRSDIVPPSGTPVAVHRREDEQPRSNLWVRVLVTSNEEGSWPILASVGAIVALVTNCSIAVQREAVASPSPAPAEPPPPSSEPPSEPAWSEPAHPTEPPPVS